MPFNIGLWSCFVLTLITRILIFFMNRTNMNSQTSFSWKLFSTVITRILEFFMDSFNVSYKTALWCSFIFTLITWIPDFIMNWFNMSLKIFLWYSFKFTLNTGILNFLMDWLYSVYVSLEFLVLLLHIHSADRDTWFACGLIQCDILNFLVVQFYICIVYRYTQFSHETHGLL